jgi:hypothetical protein
VISVILRTERYIAVLQWALAIDSLEEGQPGSSKSFGMQQRPDGDIEIDEKFWEQDFDIPSCTQCGGVLKPDVRFTVLWCEYC